MLITVVPVVPVVPVVESGMITYPPGQPSGGEDLRSINEPAELVSVAVSEERVNGEEGRGAIGGAVEGGKKYRGKAYFELAYSLYFHDKSAEFFVLESNTPEHDVEI